MGTGALTHGLFGIAGVLAVFVAGAASHTGQLTRHADCNSGCQMPRGSLNWGILVGATVGADATAYGLAAAACVLAGHVSIKSA